MAEAIGSWRPRRFLSILHCLDQNVGNVTGLCAFDGFGFAWFEQSDDRGGVVQLAIVGAKNRGVRIQTVLGPERRQLGRVLDRVESDHQKIGLRRQGHVGWKIEIDPAA